MASERKERCETCRFYEGCSSLTKSSDDAAAGWCKRFPPSVVISGGESADAASWWNPVVYADNWCGEWRAKQVGTIDESVLQMGVLELGLAVRTINALKHGNHTTKYQPIETVGQLIALTPDDLLECRDLGQVSLMDVRHHLAKHNLRLRTDKIWSDSDA